MPVTVLCNFEFHSLVSHNDETARWPTLQFNQVSPTTPCKTAQLIQEETANKSYTNKSLVHHSDQISKELNTKHKNTTIP